MFTLGTGFPMKNDSTTPTNRSVPEGLREHDKLTFDEFESVYSFDQTSDRRGIFTNFIRDEIECRDSGPTVLDIGCGSGMGVGPDRYNFVRRVKINDCRLIGIEPDVGVNPPEGLFESVERCLFEDSKLEDDSVDIAYSHYVMEHVADPQRFLTTLFRILKPGGVYFFITPNGQHYFVKTASLLNCFKADEMMLRLLRGKSTVEEYHYPVVYGFNQPRQIDPLSTKVGFAAPRYVRFEQRGGASYFPGPLRLFWWFLMQKRRWIRNPRCLGNLIGRIEKPATDAPSSSA